MLDFPVRLHVGGVAIHAHVLFELAAYAVAFQVYRMRKRRFGDPLAVETRWLLVAAAAVGAAIGSKLLSWLVDPVALLEHAGDARWLLQQKTIVGGVLGGWLAVELVKRRARVTTRTGDLFAVPLCIGIAIGRLGCFLAGLDDRTFGVASALPWAVDFGDGVARHPVQLYESAFALLLAVVLHAVEARPHVRGSVFRAFLAAYFAFRLLVDFLKPGPTFGGLGTLQWTALLVLAALAIARGRRGLVEARDA